MRRLATLLLLALLLLPVALRRLPSRPERPCVAEGRGLPPRDWLGCGSDPGLPRGLTGSERLLLGLPIDPNRAEPRELAFVPGLSAALAAETVREREIGGPFRDVEDLLRVRGIGPRRLARARPFLAVEPMRVGVAEAGE
jgi:competence protein ComEA